MNRDTILSTVTTVVLIFSSLLKPIISVILGLVLLSFGLYFAFTKKKEH